MLDPYFSLLLWFVFWLLCVIIGARKGTGCSSAIVGLLGPIGLIVVLLDHGDKVKCPYCREYIDKKAVKCPRCQSEVKPKVNIRNSNNARQYNKRSYSVGKNNQTVQSASRSDKSEKSEVINEAEQIFGSLCMDKYVGVDIRTLKMIQTAVFNSITTGDDARKELKSVLVDSDANKKKLIQSYIDTMRGDYIQAVEYAHAYNYDGDLFWEFQGSDDGATRDVCRDLLAIGFFTNYQRKIAEKLTANERAFDCRHSFKQITREYYYENVPNKDSIINRVKNHSLVSAILED